MNQFYSRWCKTLAVCTLALGSHTVMAQNNLGVGTASPSASAKLDVYSTTQGFLMPRMNQSERDAISSPAAGLMIFQTNNTPGFYYYTGSAWQAVSASGSSTAGASIYGNGSGGALTVATGNTVDLTTASPAVDPSSQFSAITITGTLIVPSGTKLRCNGNVTINGNIVVVPSTNTPFTSVGSSGHPGISGIGAVGNNTNTYAPGIRSAQVASFINIPAYGGGAGASSSIGADNTGGGGGGSFAIYANGNISIPVGGSITANGADGTIASTTVNTNGPGGGAGGLIMLVSKGTISVAGAVRANGGKGGDGATSGTTTRPGGGGGGGGVICLAASATPTVTGTLQVNGGAGGNTVTGTSTGTQYGSNGGACGGNGGTGATTGVATATAGSAGITKTIVTATPENLY